MTNLVYLAADVWRKAREANKHPGMSEQLGLLALASRGIPYALGLDAHVRPPVTLYWNINSVCNLHCKMCDVGTFNEESNFYKNLRIDRKLKEITPERFNSVVDELAPYGTMQSINGTEPLMYKRIAELVAYARSKGLEVAVTTGAYNLPERAEDLARADLSRLNVSIDGPEQLHNEIRGRKDVFERATSGIRAFRAASEALGRKPQIHVNFTISNLNTSALIAFYEDVKDLPIDRINFVPMNFVTEQMAQQHNLKWGRKYPATVTCLSDEVSPEKLDLAMLADQIARIRGIGDPRIAFVPDYSEQQLQRYYTETRTFMDSTPCMSTWYFAQIMANGEIIPFTRCYNTVLGNINEAPFLDLWNGPLAKSWRRDLRTERRFPGCARCPLVS